MIGHSSTCTCRDCQNFLTSVRQHMDRGFRYFDADYNSEMETPEAVIVYVNYPNSGIVVLSPDGAMGAVGTKTFEVLMRMSVKKENT